MQRRLLYAQESEGTGAVLLCVLVLSSARGVELSKVVICWLVGVHLAVHVLLSVHVGAQREREGERLSFVHTYTV